MTFVDYIICHETVSLRKLYYVTLIYFLKVFFIVIDLKW